MVTSAEDMREIKLRVNKKYNKNLLESTFMYVYMLAKEETTWK